MNEMDLFCLKKRPPVSGDLRQGAMGIVVMENSDLIDIALDIVIVCKEPIKGCPTHT